MNCNKETSTSDNGYIIRHVYGNVLRVAIPLTLRTIEKVNDEIVATDTDFIPSSDYPVTIEFKKDAVKVNFDAVMQNGNVAYIEDTGTIPVGTYDITVLCKDDEGKPYRFKQKTVLRVYDYTKDAGIEESIEFEAEVWYLDAAIYLALKGDKGDTGVGIQDIVISDSDESLGVNMITIILDNGNEYTFTVLNGIYDPQGYTHTDNNYTNQDKQIVSNVTNRINTLNRSAVGNVTYDALNKVLRGVPVDDGGEGTVIFQIDMTPFINDNYVEDAYLENGILTIDFNSESNRQPITIDLRDWINASNYYTKQQSDAKYMTKEEGEDFVKYNAADKINYSAMPFVLLSSLNFAYNGNPTASLIGNAYYCTDGYVRYFYRKDNRINNIYSVPIPGVLYCLKTTGDIYRWDASNRAFVLTNNNVNLTNYYTKAQIEMLLDGIEVDTSGLMSKADYTNTVVDKFSLGKMPTLALDFISGVDADPYMVDNGTVWGETNGNIMTQVNGVQHNLGKSTDVVFISKETNNQYRWDGVKWQQVGGNGSGYTTPIPKSDLSQEVQASLNKADTALQQHQDISGKADKSTTYTKTETDEAIADAVDDKLTQVVVNEISGAADIITIDDADLAFVDEDGNIAMRVADGHVETQNFDSRQVATNTTAIQQLRSQIGGNVQTDVVVKEDSEAAFDISDHNGNVVLRVGNDGHIKTKSFDSSSMDIFRQTKLDEPQCICHGYGAVTGQQPNTIPYFRAAIAKGYRFFEVDAVNCSDGVPVCTHSESNGYTVKNRTTNENETIQFSGISSTDLLAGYTWPNGTEIALLSDVIWFICYFHRFPLQVDGQGMDKASRYAASAYAESLGVGKYVIHEFDANAVYTDWDIPINPMVYPATDVVSQIRALKKPNNNVIFSFPTNFFQNEEEMAQLVKTVHDNGCYIKTLVTSGTNENVIPWFKRGFDFIVTNGITNNDI